METDIRIRIECRTTNDCIPGVQRDAHAYTVLEHVRRAVDRHPVLHGADISVGTTEDVVIHVGRTWHTGKVRRGALVDLMADAERLASEAAKARMCKECERHGPPQTSGSRCSTCGATGTES